MFQGVLRMLFSAALAAAMPAASWAADYPDRPIRWLVPFSAGGDPLYGTAVARPRCRTSPRAWCR